MDLLPKIEPVEKYVLIDLIIEKIQKLIQNGDLKPGDYMPSERILSEKLEVSRTSLRQALKALEIMGVIRIKPGKKTYIEKSFYDIFLNPFKFIDAVHPIRCKELYDTRRVIEEGVVEIVARKINKRQLENIKKSLEYSEKNINDVEKFNNSELMFQHSIIEALDNNILKSIMSSLNKFLFIFSKYERNNFSTKNRKKSLEQHKKIYEALKSKDPDKARYATRLHLDSMEKVAMEYEINK